MGRICTFFGHKECNGLDAAALGIENPRQRVLSREVEDYSISCSSASNSGVLKNSPKVISKPSHNFLIVTAPGF